MNYPMWVKLFAWSIQLMAINELPHTVSVVTDWVILSDYGITTSQFNSGLLISFNNQPDNETIQEFLLIPWQDFRIRQDESKVADSLGRFAFLGVNPFAVIYQPNALNDHPSELASALADRIVEKMRYILDLRLALRPISDKCEPVIPESGQIISFEHFPNYYSLQIAKPGTDQRNLQELNAAVSDCMIQVFLVPDIGPVESWWLQPVENRFSTCFSHTEKEILQLLETHLPQTCQLKNQIERQSALKQLHKQARKMIDDSCSDEYCKSQLSKWITHFLSFPENTQNPDPSTLFPDYHPKISPDYAVDFRPELYTYFNELPTAELKNLKVLLRAFKKVKRKARLNPGKWIDGNIVLGANPKEFIPSNEAFLLEELGMRASRLIENHSHEEIDRAMRNMLFKPRKLKFISFQFRHADVMGSGRFFYVEHMIERIIKVR